jgi:hypothetical protein
MEVGEMAEIYGKQEGNKRRAIEEAIWSQYVNRFICFYILRCFWKKYNHAVPELYSILLKSTRNGNNRTLYDRILSDKYFDMAEQAKRMSNITGVSEAYFTGEKQLPCDDIKHDDWSKFIRLRKKKQGERPASEYSAVKREVERQIEVAFRSAPKSKDFAQLDYFAQYKDKQRERTIVDRIADVERAIEDLEKRELGGVSPERLMQYRNALRLHTERVTAICVLLEWK